MNVNRVLYEALHDLVSDCCYTLQKPTEEDPEQFIVFNPENLPPADWGDDDDQEWMNNMQVHYFARGRVDYVPVIKQLRRRLKDAGFTISDINAFYDKETGSSAAGTPASKTYTHVCVYCSIDEDDPYGNAD